MDSDSPKTKTTLITWRYVSDSKRSSEDNQKALSHPIKTRDYHNRGHFSHDF